MKPELAFTYDAALRPISGKCTRCGEQMAAPPTNLSNSLEVIMWLSMLFIEHKQLKHSTPPDPDAANEMDHYAR